MREKDQTINHYIKMGISRGMHISWAVHALRLDQNWVLHLSMVLGRALELYEQGFTLRKRNFPKFHLQAILQ